MTASLILVVAAADNGVIGRDNRLLWRLKTDLRRFRDLTWGKPMIMGRKTFQSIGRPLPGRETIVLTRDAAFHADGVHVAQTWQEAVSLGENLAKAMNATEVAVVGGAEIYALALPDIKKIFLTRVHSSPAGDAIFPELALPSSGRSGGRIALKVPMTSIRLPLLISSGEVRTPAVEESCHNPQLAALTGGRQRTDNRPHHPIGFRTAGLFRVRKSDLCLGVTKAAAEAPGGNAADRAAARALGVPAAPRATVPHPDLEDILRRSQDRLKTIMPGGSMGGKGLDRASSWRHRHLASDRVLYGAAERGRHQYDLRQIHRHHR